MSLICPLADSLRRRKSFGEYPDAITQESEDGADSDADDIGCDVVCEGRFET